MDRKSLERLLTKVDDHLSSPTVMVIYGAAAFMLLGEQAQNHTLVQENLENLRNDLIMWGLT